MIKILLGLILILQMGTLFAIESEIDKLGDRERGSESVGVGEIFEGSIRFYDMTEAEKEEVINKFSSFEHGKIGSYLYLVKAKNIQVSPNNSEVIELVGSFVITKNINKEKFEIVLVRELNFPISFKKLDVKPTEQLKEPFVWSTEVLTVTEKWGYYLGGTFALVLLMVIALKVMRKRAIKKELARLKQEIVEEYRSADTREKLEKLYQKRDDLSEHFDVPSEFFEKLNEIQFKKEWTQEELALVLENKRDLTEKVVKKNGV